MTGPRRRFRIGWVITGLAVWLMIASSIGLEHGHRNLADGGTLLAVAVVAIAVLVVVLRLMGRVLLKTTRRGWASIRRARSRRSR